MDNNSENDYSETEQTIQTLDSMANAGSQFVQGVNKGFKSAISNVSDNLKIPDKKGITNNSNNSPASSETGDNKDSNMDESKEKEKKDDLEKEKSKKEKKETKDKKKKKDRKEAENKIGQKIKEFLTSNPWILIVALALLLVLIICIGFLFTSSTSITAIKAPGVLCKTGKPVEGKVISQFSWRIRSGKAEAHKGIDIEAESGTPVVAVSNGKIVDMGYDSYNGQFVKIKHDNFDGKSITTLYANLLTTDEITNFPLTNINFSVGDAVYMGEVIGYVGDSNYESGIHLHFEIISGSTQVSPNRLYDYENPIGSCHPIESNNTTVDDIEKLQCEQLIELKEDDKIKDYCDNDCFDGNYIWPLPGHKMCSASDCDFGPRNPPTEGASSYHRGIDIPAPGGTAIIAAASGIVSEAEKDHWSYGNYVTITHPDGTRTRYAHMSRLGTTKGLLVQQGDVIGYVGTTGVSTGNHLHFEIWVDGDRVDPEKYVGDGGKETLACNQYKSSNNLAVTALINIDDPMLIAQVPTNLIEYNGSKYIKEVLDAYKEMKAAAPEGITLEVNNSYRDPTKASTTSYNNYDENSKYYNIAGRYMSEHHAGLAIDFDPPTTKRESDKYYLGEKKEEYQWLKVNAVNYGFIQRYTEEGKNITQYEVEEWHWRYVGVETAKAYVASGFTSYEEFYCKRIDDSKKTCTKNNWTRTQEVSDTGQVTSSKGVTSR